MSLGTFFILFFVAYLSGSFPSGKIIASFYNVDIQKQGSGNIGFANVYRVIGRKAGFFTLLLDILKGYIPVIVAQELFQSTNLAFYIGFAAICGHIFPIWLNFKGGKGLATALGVLLSLSPVLALIAILIWFLVLNITRIFSLASLSGILTVQIVSLVIGKYQYLAVWIFVVLVFGLLLHYQNIRRLIKGEEPRSWNW